MRRSIVTLAFLLGLLLPVMTAPSYAVATDPISATHAAISWLRTQQLENGSFPGFGPGDQGFDPIFAFAAAGIDTHSVARPGGLSLVSFAQSKAQSYATVNAASAAKALLASVAADEDPHAFGGTDLVATLVHTYTITTGAYGNSGAFGQSLAILALHAAGETPPAVAVPYLVGLQAANGSWEYNTGFGADTNTTALAIEALIVARPPNHDAILAKARSYLQSVQNTDGGFSYSGGSATDANSTGYVLQAIAALGEAPADPFWTKPGGNPLSALLALQNPSGAFRYQASAPDDNVFATLQAVPGLLGKPFPLQLTRVRLPILLGAGH